MAVFWGVQSLASSVSGLISYGVFRLAGVGGLYGWKWLFLIDGVLTQVVGLVAFFYLPVSPANTSGFIFGKKGWFTERERKIAVTRLIRDDQSKTDQYKTVNWNDIKLTLVDTKLWTHLIITFIGMISITPISTYLPTIIKSYGFSVTDANLLTAPSYLINLTLSIIIARTAEKYGYMAFFAAFEILWGAIGFLALALVPIDTPKWAMYAVVLFTASTPLYHGMHIAW